MGSESGKSFIQGIFKSRRPKSVEGSISLETPVGMLERLHRGEHPDYCLYLRPPGGGRVVNTGPLSVDLETLLAQALDPLPMITLDETAKASTDAGLPEESFLTLAGAHDFCVWYRRAIRALSIVWDKSKIKGQ